MFIQPKDRKAAITLLRKHFPLIKSAPDIVNLLVGGTLSMEEDVLVRLLPTWQATGEVQGDLPSRSVRRVLQKLEAAGAVERQTGRTRFEAHKWRLVP